MEKRLNFHMLNSTGLQFTFWKNLYADVRWQYNKYIAGGHLSGFTMGVGYRMYNKKKNK